MPGILDFMTDVGADGTLAADFAAKASGDCTAADLKEFFDTNGYPDVTDADVQKILNQKDNIKQDFRVPEDVDY
jgi:hypothetical protein